MTAEIFAQQIRNQREFFERATGCFKEEHSGFAPVEGTYTVAQHVSHVAQVIRWFRHGAFSPEGFDMDFETQDAEVRKVESITKARAWFEQETEALANLLESKSIDELLASIVPGEIMGGEPRYALVGALADHTAHHRGALSVYARHLGLMPTMPYLAT